MRIFPGKRRQTGCINTVARLDGAPAQTTLQRDGEPQLNGMPHFKLLENIYITQQSNSEPQARVQGNQGELDSVTQCKTLL